LEGSFGRWSAHLKDVCGDGSYGNTATKLRLDWVDPMGVYWLEQIEADVPNENNWLSARELIFLGRLRFAHRRADWRLGRWTAKQAVAACLNLASSPSAFARIEIVPAPSGAPEVFLDNKLSAVTISLSHRNHTAICAVGRGAFELGCDLELIEPRTDAFLSDYFTAEEQALIATRPATDRPRLLALLWSAKESALKALTCGLRLDTRSVIVDPADLSFGLNGWRPLQVRYTGGQIFHGWWQIANDMVRTVVSSPPPARPIALQLSHSSATRNLGPELVKTMMEKALDLELSL
jgi:4'-phosphopantetheinyl transferase